jgi:hypothetical protein
MTAVIEAIAMTIETGERWRWGMMTISQSVEAGVSRGLTAAPSG